MFEIVSIHVRDRLDARVGDHADRDREDEVLPRRGDAEHDVRRQLRRVRAEHEHGPDDHQQHLRKKVHDGQRDVQARRLLGPDDVDHGQDRDDDGAGDDVARGVAERVPEDAAEVVRDEERADRDGHHVVEHLAPGGEEGPELVERAAGEARGAARLRIHRRRLGVGGRGAQEEDAGDHEDDRRQAQRVARDQAERVIDRRTHVPVGGREEGVDPQDPF
jgi:hypothetical protein